MSNSNRFSISSQTKWKEKRCTKANDFCCPKKLDHQARCDFWGCLEDEKSPMCRLWDVPPNFSMVWLHWLILGPSVSCTGGPKINRKVPQHCRVWGLAAAPSYRWHQSKQLQCHCISLHCDCSLGKWTGLPQSYHCHKSSTGLNEIFDKAKKIRVYCFITVMLIQTGLSFLRSSSVKKLHICIVYVLYTYTIFNTLECLKDIELSDKELS